MSTNKPTLYYLYDALCGWCYGFSPVINALYAKYQDQIDFRVLSGGLVTGERIGPIGVVAGYIKDAYKNVEETTGVKFGEAFLDEVLEPGNEQFTSIPPALAMALFRNQLPQRQLEFATRIQKAIYYEGMAPSEWTTYGQLATEFGLNEIEFAEKMQHPKLEELIFEEFKIPQQWGINGFPALVFQNENGAALISHGYQPLEQVENALEKIRDNFARKAED